jgi:hypothetical protein
VLIDASGKIILMLIVYRFTMFVTRAIVKFLKIEIPPNFHWTSDY